MDLVRLQSFVESVRLGSFAAAADALGYTGPAVSQHVAHLERELGCELLTRGARGVQPTHPGSVLFDRAERLLIDARAAALAVGEAAGLLRSLSVGSFPSAAQRLVPQALAHLRSSHDDLELSLQHFEPPDGLAQLAAGEVDAVVTHRYPGVAWSAPTGVRLANLWSDPLVLMVPVDHWLARRSWVDIGRLRDEVLISGTPADANRVALALACSSARFIPHVAFETTDYVATARLVSLGFGIAVVPRLAWPVAAADVAEVSLRVDGRSMSRQVALAHRIGRLSPLVDEFRTLLLGAA